MPSLRGNATTATGTTASLNVTRPTGVVSGDLMFALQQSEYSLSGGLPSGWTQIYSSFSGFAARLSYRVAGAGEPSSYSFGGGIGGGVRHNVILIAIADADPDTRTLQSGNAGSTYTVTAPAATAERDSALVVRFGLVATNPAATWTPPSGHTERAEISQIHGCSCATQDALAGAGSVAAASFTVSQEIWEDAGFNPRLGITLIVYPPPGGGRRAVVSAAAVHRAWSW